MSPAAAMSVYAACAVAYAVLALLVRPTRRGEQARHGRLHVAAVGTVLWAGLSAWMVGTGRIDTELSKLGSVLLLALWLWQFEPMLRAAAQPAWFGRLLSIGAPAVAMGLFLVSVLPLPTPLHDELARLTGVVGVLLAAIGLVALEQLHRNASAQAAAAMRWFCLGIGGLFVVELFTFADLFLQGFITVEFWVGTGALVTLAALPIGLGARRMPDWSVGFFVSRHVVFYTTTFIVVGAYLILASVGAWMLPQVGGEWGRMIQGTILLAGGLLLAVMLFSGSLRRRLMVFISTHFYRNRYDYRFEWLRFIGTLSNADSGIPVKQRAIRAVTQIIESPLGILWALEETAEQYSCTSSWPDQPPADMQRTVVQAKDVLPDFMRRSGWLIDLEELRDKPELYDGLRSSDLPPALPESALIVPLLHINQLYGWLVLEKSAGLGELTFEDRDLLKIAGRQVAAYLAQIDADERLAEARQFEAYSRMTAFVMHDLKNIAAQLGLVAQNAERHKRNPAFIDDAMQTIGLSVTRMGKLIHQLTSGEAPDVPHGIDLASVAERVVVRCGSRVPVPQIDIRARPMVFADHERLANVLEHAIRNAQDATPADGEIRVVIDEVGAAPRVLVVDTGVGMESSFIRDRLFRPFDTTKGSKGMGIGAFQIREYIRSLGGLVEVTSQPGRGTTLALQFPVATRGADVRRAG